jgi:hypothetical protein
MISALFFYVDNFRVIRPSNCGPANITAPHFT